MAGLSLNQAFAGKHLDILTKNNLGLGEDIWLTQNRTNCNIHIIMTDQTQKVPWRSFLARIVLPTMLTIILFLSAIFYIIIPTIEKNSVDRKREMIRELTNSAWNILAKFEYDEQKGILNREDAQTQAIAQIKNLHYGQHMKDYFWINDMHPTMVIHPYRTDLNGKDLTDYKDPNGKRVFVEFVNIVKKNGSGYVEYMWQWKDDETRIVPKISYVKGFTPWGWIIGTGIYIEDVKAEIAEITTNIIQISAAILLIAIFLLFFIIAQNYQTEMKRYVAEQETRDSEKRFRTLVENSHTGIFIIQDDRIVYKNPEQERLFGPLPDDFKIINFDKIYPDDVETVKDFYQSVNSGRVKALSIEYRFYSMGEGRKEASLRWAHSNISAIEYMGRRATLVNMLDITREKEMEALLGVKDKMISLGHVAAGIAHEIRNPLSGVNILLDAIRERLSRLEDSQEFTELIGHAKTATGKIEGVIKRVLDFSRPSTPQLKPENINGVIKETVMLSSVTLRKAGIKLETDLDDNLPEIMIDRQQIEQVLMNLITNASEILKNSEADKKIYIESRLDLRSVVVLVSDSGPGISRPDAKKIFDPFYTTKSDGSGIGLSICQRIIADHKGTISVLASVLGGAEFCIRIPVQEGDEI